MKRIVLLTFIAFTVLTSCSDETTVFEAPAKDNLRLELNENLLVNSILYEKAGVLDIEDEATITGKKISAAKNDVAGDYPLTLVAQVAVPSFEGGQNLTASHVDVDGDYAYVSYNTVEDGYAGGVDIINISDPNNPRVTSRLYYSNADINAIDYDNGYVYLAGGVDSESSVRATDNSFVAKIQTVNGRLNLDAGISYGFQEGFNATDVKVSGNEVFLTSGRDGFVKAYNTADLSITKEAAFADLRAVAIQGNSVAVLDASKGVTIMDQNLNTTRDIAINSDFGLNTKRTLDFSGEHIVVAEGSKGAGIYNATNGNLIEYVPILLNPDNVADMDQVTNAVATNEDVLLMANGGAGLCLSEEQNNNTDLVGVIQLEGSINFVASKGDYVFAASGREGLQIIKLNRLNESLVTRCESLEPYAGSANLNINSGSTAAYRGAKRFSNININGALLLCGSWTVRNNAIIGTDGLFEMNGTFVVGRNNRRRSVIVDSGATLRVEGNLTIYGDLLLNNGATVEFIGENSVVNIFGNVTRNGNATVKGTYRDVRNKF